MEGTDDAAAFISRVGIFSTARKNLIFPDHLFFLSMVRNHRQTDSKKTFDVRQPRCHL